MVIIYQPKSRRFEKPVSAEVAQLIKKAIVYAEQNYKESIYIFANKDNPQKPLNYQTLREKVIRMIYENVCEMIRENYLDLDHIYSDIPMG